MKTAALLLIFAGAAAATTCETVMFDTSCCVPSKIQPMNTYGSVAANYACTNCEKWGSFNQTYFQGYGKYGDMVPSAAVYVGTKGSGFGTFSNTDVKGVSRYEFTHSNGKCTSTAVAGSTTVIMPVSFCYEDTEEDCHLG